MSTHDRRPRRQVAAHEREHFPPVTTPPRGMISRQVLDKLEGTQNRLRRELAQLERAARLEQRGDLANRAQHIAWCFESHSNLLDAVLEALSEDPLALDERG